MAWSWEVDAVGFYTEYHTVFVVAATLYYPVIFGLRAALEKRDAFDLGGSGSKAVVNWIFWWELALAVFSLSLIHISEPTRLLSISYAVFCLKKKKKKKTKVGLSNKIKNKEI
eukprot:TRINITY_DN5325_c0_g1_i1.p1 TRINITY_DN5325_c0_g1~~TRINITY_DN5325_c0_g1_i1.p1  ORF type:complete len:113 (-),score=31.46 TRINITY_DN5325_c0_g1_i1:70-408(-)